MVCASFKVFAATVLNVAHLCVPKPISTSFVQNATWSCFALVFDRTNGHNVDDGKRIFEPEGMYQFNKTPWNKTNTHCHFDGLLYALF